MTLECELINITPQPTLYIRTRSPVQGLSQVMGEAFGKIAQHLGKQGTVPAGPPYAAYHNMDMQDLDVEIGFPVGDGITGGDEILVGELPDGKYAACLYTGPYSEIPPAYNALEAWIQEQGFKATGIAYEVYLNDPAVTPPDRLQTRVMFPLRD